MRNPHNERLTSDSNGSRPERAQRSGVSTDALKTDAPERRCILTGRHDERDHLVRLAISPDGLVLPDALARAPGRGAWIGVSRATLEIALTKGKLKGALARAFKGAALTIPEDLPERIEVALTRAVTERLGLELRSGRLLMGSDRIAENARMGKVAWLAHASDAGEDGNRKLDQALRVGNDAEGSGLTGEILPLDRAALSVALGRDNVVHLALTDRAAAERLAAPLGRLIQYLGRASDSLWDDHSQEDAGGNDDADAAGLDASVATT